MEYRLYEEKTDNDMIFIERNKALSRDMTGQKPDVLETALGAKSNRIVKKALTEVVPAYHTPEEKRAAAGMASGDYPEHRTGKNCKQI
ncbi:MAG: hypothetical protein IKD66_11785 [Solobacterium sp.]|nr:hypothetical protein [Solobacterium sp.]